MSLNLEATHVDAVFCNNLKSTITSHLTNLGLIAALLSSWGVSVYAEGTHDDGGRCLGEVGIKSAVALFWFSLGFFFLCVCSTIALQVDLNGVPEFFFIEHFRNSKVRFAYVIPEVSIGERTKRANERTSSSLVRFVHLSF